VLYALNAGPDAVADLRVALDDILGAFRTGADSFWTDWFRPKIDRVLFAATKADHVNSISHDRLEAILRLIVERSMRRIGDSGARIDVIALASVRATREADVRDGSTTLPAIAGVPLKGEVIDDVLFDGVREAVIFPGDLPVKPEQAIDSGFPKGSMQFVRFRPPLIEARDRAFPLPHIRLDRALEFLIGDQLP
jgi:predicted YcjX-like family ATPase